MILHTINQSPHAHTRTNLCLEFCQPDDAVLLLENGVYSLTHRLLSDLIAKQVKVYVLEVDALARGLPENGIGDTATSQMISYDEFVTLCAIADKVVSW